MHAGTIDGGNHVLHGARRGRHHVDAHFQACSHHAQRIVHSALIVEDEFLRQEVQDFAIGGERNRAGLFDRRREFRRGQFRAPGLRNSGRHGC